jgi:MYXO-CTERM domain-containing protein
MRTSISLSLLALMLSVSGMAHAVSVSIGGCATPDNSGLSTCEVGTTVQTFDSGTLPSTYQNTAGAGGQVVTGNLSGQYAAPANDASAFLAVPGPALGSGTVTATPGGNYNYFGLYWGSIDSFNTLTFLENGVATASFTGDQVISDAALNGNQVSPGSNEYVNFYGLNYNSVQFGSSNRAFESDNHAFGNVVPTPASMGLMGLGLLALGGAGRLRRRAAVSAI